MSEQEKPQDILDRAFPYGEDDLDVPVIFVPSVSFDPMFASDSNVQFYYLEQEGPRYYWEQERPR